MDDKVISNRSVFISKRPARLIQSLRRLTFEGANFDGKNIFLIEEVFSPV